ncbi:MAG: selenide, water dikinase SelD [SAR202 cluster bacterium]|nr:selenide, water dikinase SelD [Chloroflexota bacterium]MED5237515.1 selenide, water dikinase SelD [Chloroflexota bacterium]MQF83255.1 selenide, water dikinase SelD [SAR202 cluster bacterium]
MEVLDRVLGQINKSFSSDKILVDQKTKDDAAVYKITDDKAIIFTTDFFAPVVDDAFLFGQVAAANAISDVYAMGGKPTLALNICCFADNIPEKSIEEIIQGGIEKANEAGVIIAGGHTINDPEPKYGLAVIGEINPKNLMTLKNAKPNQDIVITKPLGNGILISAAKNSKIDLSEHPNCLKFMTELNKIASEIAVDMNIEACTDITGFGLIGHLKNILRASNVSAKIDFANIPILDSVKKLSSEENWSSGLINNEKALEHNIIWNKSISESEKKILFDPQTSGGLLFTVDKSKSIEFQSKLSKNNLAVSKIGITVEKTNYEIEFL